MISQQDPRAPLLQALFHYKLTHPERQETANHFIRFITSTSDCFKRSHRAGHLTGSAWLVNPAESCALLTLHHKLQKWLQPGGHADGDPNLLQVAIREAEEESGISGIVPITPAIFDLDIHLIPARPERDEPEHLHYDVRYLLQAPHENWTISPESDVLAWWSWEQLIHESHLLDESVNRLTRLWMQKNHSTRETNLTFS